MTDRLQFLLEVALLDAFSTCLPQGAHVYLLDYQHDGYRVFPHEALAQLRQADTVRYDQDLQLLSDSGADVIVLSTSFDLGCVSWADWDLPRAGHFPGELTVFGADFPRAFSEVMHQDLREWLGRPRS